MRGLWLLVHYLGFILWLGGGLAAMIAGVTAKRFAPAERLAAYRLTSAIQRGLVMPGAIGVVLSGFVLLQPYMRADAMSGGWLHTMLGAGTLGALIAIFGSVPIAARMGRLQLDPRGELPESFVHLRRKQIWVATIAGGLGLVALFAATLMRF